MRALIKLKESWEQAIYEWLCIGIVVSLVFFPIGVSLFGIALFVVWLLVTAPKRGKSGVNKKLVVLFCSLYILVLVGIFYSQNIEAALFKAQQKSALAVFPIVFGFSNVLKAENIRRISFSLVVSALIGCLYCLLMGSIHFFKTGETQLLNGHPLVMLREMNPYLMAFICVMAMLFCFEALLKKSNERPIIKWFLIIAITFFSLFIILIGNRTVIACWLITSCVYYFRLFNSIWFRVIGPLSLLIVVGLAIVFVPELNRQVKELTDDSANTTIPLDQDGSLGRSWGGKAIRIAIWRCSMDIIKERPLVGVGVGDSQDALQQAYENRMFYFASRYNRYNAHNQYLQELIGSGLVGLIVWLACLTIPLVLSWKNADPVYFIFLVCIATIGFTESLLELSKGVVLYSFFNSLFAFTQRKPIAL